jgi:hypothetical protein
MHMGSPGSSKVSLGFAGMKPVRETLLGGRHREPPKVAGLVQPDERLRLATRLTSRDVRLSTLLYWREDDCESLEMAASPGFVLSMRWVGN